VTKRPPWSLHATGEILDGVALGLSFAAQTVRSEHGGVSSCYAEYAGRLGKAFCRIEESKRFRKNRRCCCTLEELNPLLDQDRDVSALRPSALRPHAGVLVSQAVGYELFVCPVAQVAPDIDAGVLGSNDPGHGPQLSRRR
jgi:hypothetical protein